nr:MAG TPA: hypothetical protein [Caudoviricetes sp.]
MEIFLYKDMLLLLLLYFFFYKKEYNLYYNFSLCYNFLMVLRSKYRHF